MASLGHPCKFQWVSRVGSVTARHSSIGRQPNFAALNRGRHLYSAGRPSRWALAHILVCYVRNLEQDMLNKYFNYTRERRVKMFVQHVLSAVPYSYESHGCVSCCFAVVRLNSSATAVLFSLNNNYINLLISRGIRNDFR